jgi:hypothetical protein
MLEFPIKNIENISLLDECYFMDIPGLNEYKNPYMDIIFKLLTLDDIKFEIIIFDSTNIGSDGILNVIKGQKTKLGFPEMIQGNEYSAMQLLNIVLNKKPGAGKTYLEMIEIVFKEDSVDLFKSTGPFEDLTFYEGLYDDFKDIFDNNIHPSSDTGYKITDDVKLFWEAGMKLNKRLNDSQQLDNDSIKSAF